MGFWSGYWSSLKPLEVEEPIDVYVHRPLAYVLARASFHLPISPDFITLLSIFARTSSVLSLMIELLLNQHAGGPLLLFSTAEYCIPWLFGAMRVSASL